MVKVDVGPIGRAVTGVAGRGKPSCSVTRICGSLEICLVAAVAGCRQCSVVVIRMTLRAWHGGVCASERENCCMIESGGRPVAGGVTERAVGGETRSRMARIVRTIEVGLVAPIASRGKRRVVVVRVATRTGHRRVSSRKRERSVVVIEGRERPRGRVVALRTACRKS